MNINININVDLDAFLTLDEDDVAKLIGNANRLRAGGVSVNPPAPRIDGGELARLREAFTRSENERTGTTKVFRKVTSGMLQASGHADPLSFLRAWERGEIVMGGAGNEPDLLDGEDGEDFAIDFDAPPID